MRYLITYTDGSQPFLTKWYDYENNYSFGMVVFDLRVRAFTTDGHTWNELPEDCL